MADYGESLPGRATSPVTDMQFLMQGAAGGHQPMQRALSMIGSRYQGMPQFIDAYAKQAGVDPTTVEQRLRGIVPGKMLGAPTDSGLQAPTLQGNPQIASGPPGPSAMNQLAQATTTSGTPALQPMRAGGLADLGARHPGGQLRLGGGGLPGLIPVDMTFTRTRPSESFDPAHPSDSYIPSAPPITRVRPSEEGLKSSQFTPIPGYPNARQLNPEDFLPAPDAPASASAPMMRAGGLARFADGGDAGDMIDPRLQEALDAGYMPDVPEPDRSAFYDPSIPPMPGPAPRNRPTRGAQLPVDRRGEPATQLDPTTAMLGEYDLMGPTPGTVPGPAEASAIGSKGKDVLATLNTSRPQGGGLQSLGDQRPGGYGTPPDLMADQPSDDIPFPHSKPMVPVSHVTRAGADTTLPPPPPPALAAASAAGAEVPVDRDKFAGDSTAPTPNTDADTLLDRARMQKPTPPDTKAAASSGGFGDPKTMALLGLASGFLGAGRRRGETAQTALMRALGEGVGGAAAAGQRAQQYQIQQQRADAYDKMAQARLEQAERYMNPEYQQSMMQKGKAAEFNAQLGFVKQANPGISDSAAAQKVIDMMTGSVGQQRNANTLSLGQENADIRRDLGQQRINIQLENADRPKGSALDIAGYIPYLKKAYPGKSDQEYAQMALDLSRGGTQQAGIAERAATQEASQSERTRKDAREALSTYPDYTLAKPADKKRMEDEYIKGEPQQQPAAANAADPLGIR